MTIKVCTCGKEFDDYSKYGPRKYCSRKCANSGPWSEEHKKLLSERAKEVHANRTPEERRAMAKRAAQVAISNKHQKMLDTPTELLSKDLRKKKVFLEQNGKCLECGISEWQGNPITLELDHIDGDNTNNIRSNLRILCPNCHSQTPTWKRGNKPHWKSKVLKDQWGK